MRSSRKPAAPKPTLCVHAIFNTTVGIVSIPGAHVPKLTAEAWGSRLGAVTPCEPATLLELVELRRGLVFGNIAICGL